MSIITTQSNVSLLCKNAFGLLWPWPWTSDVPRHCLSSYGRRAFSVAGPAAWTGYQTVWDLAISRDSFKCSLKTFLFQLTRAHSVLELYGRCTLQIYLLTYSLTLTMKTFSAIATHMIMTCGKIHQYPSTNWKDIASRGMVLTDQPCTAGWPDGIQENTSLSPPTVGRRG